MMGITSAVGVLAASTAAIARVAALSGHVSAPRRGIAALLCAGVAAPNEH
jgi:hypothetical protein